MTTVLCEREAETAAIDLMIAGLDRGRGSSLVIRAGAGHGKSVLLEHANHLARASGMAVLSVRAGHLEAAAPFGVLRRCLAGTVHARGGPRALEGTAAFARSLFTPGAEIDAGVDLGCQSLILRLAESSPLLLSVDDAHWADPASVRVLLDLGLDVDAVPVALVVAARPVENPGVQSLLDALAAAPTTRTLRPAALSAAAVAAVVRSLTGSSASAAFIEECVTASGGNPFYLTELVRGLRAPTAARAGDDDRGGHRSIALVEAVSARLGQLGPVARAVAESAAVLGDDSALAHVAALAGTSYAVAGEHAARLEAASVLAGQDPVRFPHPLIRAAVESTMTTARVGALHTAALIRLRDTDAPLSQQLPHLLATLPAGDNEVCRSLLEHGNSTLRAGSPASSLPLLRRALAEPPSDTLRGPVLLGLALAERAQGLLADALDHLVEAAGCGSRDVVLAAVAEWFEVLYDLGRLDDVPSLHGRATALRPWGDSPEEIRLQAQLLSNISMGGRAVFPPAPRELTRASAAELSIGSGVHRHLLVMAAMFERGFGGSSGALVRELRRAVSDLPPDRPLDRWEVHAMLEAATLLAANDALDESDAVLARSVPDAARLRNAAPDLQAELYHRQAMNALRRGAFEDVTQVIAAGSAFVTTRGLDVYLTHWEFVQACVLLERGEYPAAGRRLQGYRSDDPVVPALGALLRGDPGGAIDALAPLRLASEVGSPAEPIEIGLEPHLVASHAREGLGDRAGAHREAQRELDIRRRFGSAPKLALALRRAATFANLNEAVELLREARAVADAIPHRPVRARVLVSYGAVLRRRGRPADARAELAVALDLATQLGMDRLAERARVELRRAGGRPRRARTTGIDALTSGQRLVVERALAHRTNRQIGEDLYIGIKTVESHLAASYRKLGVAGRAQLIETYATLTADSTSVAADAEGARPAPVRRPD